MSGHTPGPWIAATAFSSVVGLPIVAQNGRSVASVTFFRLGDDFENHDQESHANARLIAAAPDLLMALRGLYDALPDCDHGSLGAACVVARAAIAKAEGRS